MEASAVTEIIEREVAGDWSLSNDHGVDLNKCLVVPPVRQIYEVSFREGQTMELWLVLEEVPVDKSGYKIVFDEVSKAFGLAMLGAGEKDVFLGFYGTFLETLRGM